jgi:DNA-binding GntR family transcriptional regulator
VSEPTLVTPAMSERLAAVIRDAIMKGILEPEKLYSVQQIAQLLDLGLSRTPVREALVRLADAGLVSFHRNRGVLILKPAVHNLEELFQLRLMVEVPATYRGVRYVDEMLTYRMESEISAMERAVTVSGELGAKAVDRADGNSRIKTVNSIIEDFIKHDTAFHELVIGASGNQVLARTVRGWREIITTLGGWRLTKPQALETLLKEHAEILHAIKERDAAAAARAMYEHVRHTGDFLMKELQQELPDSGTFDPRWHEGIAIQYVGNTMDGSAL